jgi:uncharacterized surface protein with fasciclin (FAS1) repeats
MRLNDLLAATALIALVAGSAVAQDSAPPKTEAPQTPPAAAAKPAAGDIIQTAEALGQFATFLKAAEAANLTDMLKTSENLTVFAPNDAAFAALPAGDLEKLMLPENKAELQKLLAAHVVNARVKSVDFKGVARKAPTLAGTTVELSGGDKLMVNDAAIVQADVPASNGVIQVIDKVLLPAVGTSSIRASDLAPDPAATPRYGRRGGN